MTSWPGFRPCSRHTSNGHQEDHEPSGEEQGPPLTQREQECVGLQVARLQPPQRAANQFCGAMGPAHDCAGDDPAVEPAGDGGEKLVRSDDRRLV